MQEYLIDNHEHSLLPDGKKWSLAWADEFDGDKLDDSKWTARTHMMGKRAKHLVEDAFEIKDSNIIFKLENRDGVYCTTQLETGFNFMDGEGEAYDATAAEGYDNASEDENYFTWPIGKINEPKFMHKFGYYECRCKLQEKKGWWSAFWIQSPTIGATLNPETAGVEVDIMEYFQHEKDVVQCNNHWSGYGSQHKSTGAFETKVNPTDDGYHRFGVHWKPDGYDYYVDGVLVNSFTEPVSQIEEFILLSTEAVGYRTASWNMWDELKKSQGDTWTVDYVRVFDEIN